MMDKNFWYILSLLLLLCSSTTIGFVISANTKHGIAELRATKSNNNGRTPRRQQRRRRFQQDVHGMEEEERKQPLRFDNKESDGIWSNSIPDQNINSKIGNNKTYQKARQSSSFSRSSRQASPPRNDIENQDYMWRTSKSIDDLEANMMKRWGNNQNSFMADPSEYELVDATKSTKSKAYRKDRDQQQRKVLDPWEKASRDYYDEDDEGYEVDYDDDNEDTVGRLISPRPVGGRGSLQEDDSWNSPTNDSPGYFFNPNAALPKEKPASKTKLRILKEQKPKKRDNNKKQQTSAQHGNNTKKKKKKKETIKKKRSTPLLDDEGRPLYLTLEQAERQGSEEAYFEDEDDVEPASWTDLGIHSPPLLDNLDEMNCLSPLPVQTQSCPAILDESRKDVIIGTFTGSGKTLAFLVPLLEQLSKEEEDNKSIKIVVVAPGRELASQITSVARDLLPPGKKVVMAIGGTSFKKNFDQIRKAKPVIVVGTPGRIAELVVGAAGEKSGRMKVANVQSLVLDEFDALLEYKPHRDPTKAILSTLQRKLPNLQTVLCSATAVDMQEKIQSYIRPDPLIIQDMSEKKIRMSQTIVHGVIHVPRPQLALETVRRILHTNPMPPQVLIFCESSERVETVVKLLREKVNIIAAPLHGNSNKQERQEVSQALRDGQVGLVVATELAARGLDAPYLTHVLNLDLPTDSSHYAHRAGRCGRGGRPGVVLNFTFRNEQRNVPAKLTSALDVPLYTVETYEGKLQIVDPSSVNFT